MKPFAYSILIAWVLSLPLKGQTPSEVSITKDIVYGHTGGVDLKLDIGYPKGKGPFPVILFFHGGGWQQGDKWHMHRWIQKFASSGYAGVAVGYRFAPEFKWPSQIQDAKTAVRYLRAHAKELNIDPNRIGAMGESAGGYLALMLGVTSPPDGLDGENEYAEFSSRVQAVTSFFSATDFTLPPTQLTPEQDEEMLKYYKKPLKEVRSDFTGASGPDDPILKKISVLPYVDKDDAPILMFHGDSDPFLTLEHPKKLQETLEKVKVPNQLIVVKGGGHGWTGKTLEETTLQMLEFFERILKGSK